MKLILVRHGETAHNVRGIVQGHSNSPLSERGRKENKKISDELSDIDIDLIYSSDLGRAVETAREISKKHPGVRLELTALLRERNYGARENKERPAHWEGTKRSKYDAPGGEGWADVERRIKEFVMELKQGDMDSTVLIVGHNGSIGVLIPTLLGEADYSRWLDSRFENSKPIFIELTESSAKIVE